MLKRLILIIWSNNIMLNSKVLLMLVFKKTQTYENSCKWAILFLLPPQWRCYGWWHLGRNFVVSRFIMYSCKKLYFKGSTRSTVGKLPLGDVNLVALVLNRNTKKKLRLYFIDMFSRVWNCFHLSMYFRVIKQDHVFIALSTNTNCDAEFQYKHFKESR